MKVSLKIIVNIKKRINMYCTPVCTRAKRYTKKCKFRKHLLSSFCISGAGDPRVNSPVTSVRDGQNLNRFPATAGPFQLGNLRSVSERDYL